MAQPWTRRAKRWLRRHAWLAPKRISAGVLGHIPWIRADWERARPTPRMRPRRTAPKTPRAVRPQPVEADYRIVTAPKLPEAGIVPAYGNGSWPSQFTTSNPSGLVWNRLVELGVNHCVGRVEDDLEHEDYADAVVSGFVALWLDSLKK